MHYLISDIHGCYEQYIKMLKKINFTSADNLIVVGDVFDKGPNPMDVISHMMRHSNIQFIAGNHELMGLPVLEALFNDEDVNQEQYLQWAFNGCEPTLNGFVKLHKRNQEKVLDYLKKSAMYMELEVDGVQYLITHAGFDYDDFDQNKPLDSYDWSRCVWAETEYDKVYFADKILVTGHTPTWLIDKSNPQRIYKGNNHIAIDCGCAYGGALACYCLETGEEYYV